MPSVKKQRILIIKLVVEILFGSCIIKSKFKLLTNYIMFTEFILINSLVRFNEQSLLNEINDRSYSISSYFHDKKCLSAELWLQWKHRNSDKLINWWLKKQPWNSKITCKWRLWDWKFFKLYEIVTLDAEWLLTLDGLDLFTLLEVILNLDQLNKFVCYNFHYDRILSIVPLNLLMFLQLQQKGSNLSHKISSNNLSSKYLCTEYLLQSH